MHGTTMAMKGHLNLEYDALDIDSTIVYRHNLQQDTTNRSPIYLV